MCEIAQPGCTLGVLDESRVRFFEEAARGEPDRAASSRRPTDVLLRQLLVEPAIGTPTCSAHATARSRYGIPVWVDLELGASCRLRNGRSRSRLGSPALAREPRARARTRRALRRARPPRRAPSEVVEERPEPVARVSMGFASSIPRSVHATKASRSGAASAAMCAASAAMKNPPASSAIAKADSKSGSAASRLPFECRSRPRSRSIRARAFSRRRPAPAPPRRAARRRRSHREVLGFERAD